MNDLVLFNANVITMDPVLPEARYVVVREGKIVEVGAHGPMDTRVPSECASSIHLDLGGRTVLPGFVDAHCHVRAFAESLVSLDLSPKAGVDSIRAMQDMVRDSCGKSAPGTWVRGRGYHEFSLAERRHPSRWDLDAAAPDHPVRVTHRSGHAHVLNSLAMRLVGVTDESGDPPGGMIDRALGTGEPTGLLFGMGGYLAERVPRTGEGEIENGVVRANEWFLSRGITSVQDASVHNGPAEWKSFERLIKKGVLTPRVTMMMGLPGFREWEKSGRAGAVPDERLGLGPVKIIAGEVTGSLCPTRDELDRTVLEIHASAMQAAIHAVEENTIEAACVSIERAFTALPRVDHRHRIEHCFVCPPWLAKRLGDSGVVVVTQPSFLYESGDRYLKTVPAGQNPYLYPISTMAKSGILVAFGSDAPVVAPDPLAGIRAAVDRTSAAGRVVLGEEGIDVIDALRMHTLDAAKAVFEETRKGSVSPGKAADLVVLSADPRTIVPARIGDLMVDMTIIGGEIVWKRPGS